MTLTTDSDTSTRLELNDITKTYPAVIANDRVSMTVKRGEIHAVLGENGAGKSTLMKMIYGVTKPDSGEMKWQGESVQRMRAVSVLAWYFSISRYLRPSPWFRMSRFHCLTTST
jgi:ABC-type sugar transport system ATPase subunit